MYCIKINIIFFILITIFSCFVKIKNSEKNNVNFINYEKKFKRNVGLQGSQDKLYDNQFFDNQNKKRSINSFSNEKNYREKRMVRLWYYKKWGLTIPYFTDVYVNHRLIDLALQMMQKETCIKFVKYSRMDPNITGLRYFYGHDCSSPIGKPKSRVWLDISIGHRCDTIKVIQHETMHALGFFHVHARYDRDKYLYVLKQNVNPAFYSEIKKVNRSNSRTFDVPFDFGSVMLYTADTYTTNGEKTMVPLDINFIRIQGYAQKLSFADAKIINLYYCQNVCRKKIRCMNGGYQDPNNCNNCKCVKGYGGRWCQFLTLFTIECGEPVIIVNSKIALFQVSGSKNCIYHVFSSRKQRVAMYLVKSGFFPNNLHSCDKKNSLEIKYWNDKVPTGAYFCHVTKNVLVVTEKNHGIIYFRSFNPVNQVFILLKAIPKYYDNNNLRNEFIVEKTRLRL
uniref:Metalloendopeptidase n=1 Tax=Strongyloides stercoralis TaxID=6248 RepID=A0A0K0EJK0_STRER